jgi:Uma2 family endonuclease
MILTNNREVLMSSAAKKPSITPDDYLAREREAEFKSEYYAGQVYAMAGTSYRHNVILSNIHGELFAQLRGQICRPSFSDVRLRTTAWDAYMYPDLMVICGQPLFAPNEFDTVLNPTVIIEVLSVSTESWDRGGKFAHYRRIESLNDYVLVSQDKVLVERYTRQGEQWLLTEWSRLEDSLQLPSIGCEVTLRDIYAKVPLESEA